MTTGPRAALAVLVLSTAAADARPQAPLTTFSMDPCRSDLWAVSHIGGWHTSWPAQADAQPVETPEQRAAALERWRGFPEAVDQEIAVLRKGLREGYSAARPVTRRVLDQLDALLDPDDDAAPLLGPARRADDSAFVRAWRGLARDDLVPALRRYRTFLASEYLPSSREQPGLHVLPGGVACYRAVVRRWTTLDLAPAEIRLRGEEELERQTAKLRRLVGEERATLPLPELLEAVRRDTAGTFETRDEVVAFAEAAVERAREGLSGWFHERPETPLRVHPIPEYLEASTPAAFYSPAGAGGSASFMVKTSRPGSRRLMAEVVAFHEGLPGHHLQMALARESGAAGAGSNAGYVEGWAHYAQRLAEEMGLYSTLRDRIGLVAQNLWSSARLVVDVGLNVDGWDREQAMRFYLDHTLLDEAQAVVEVDRILALPGQGVAYVLGHQAILALRQEAKAALGEAFDIRDFHRVVLSGGARPIGQLTREVRSWIARTGSH